MSTYGSMLLFFVIKNTVFDFLTPINIKLFLLITIFVFSFFFPMLNIFILFKIKKINALTLSIQKDRTLPYIISSLFYFSLFYFLSETPIWKSIKLFILGGGIAILLTALINLKFKISAHMVGIGGILGLLISISYIIQFDFTFFYILIIIISGIIGSSRLILMAHKPVEIYSGFLLGLVIQILLFFNLEKIIIN